MTLTLGNCGPESDWPYQGSIEAAKSFGANMKLMVRNIFKHIQTYEDILNRLNGSSRIGMNLKKGLFYLPDHEIWGLGSTFYCRKI